MKIIDTKILLVYFLAILITPSCFNIKKTNNNHKERILNKNNIVDIAVLYQQNKGDDYEQILILDSLLSGVADTLIGIRKKYEIIYYFHNGTFGVNSWEIVRFNDTSGAKVYHCHSDKRNNVSRFQIDDLKKFIFEKNLFENKFSYNDGITFDYRKYLVFKENDRIIFCGIWINAIPDENFESTSFINNYLKTVDASCQ